MRSGGRLSSRPLSPEDLITLNEEIAATTQMLVELAIQQHLSREVSDARVRVRIDGSALLIDVTYTIVATGEAGEANLRAEAVS